MPEQFENNYITQLNGPIGAGDTTLTVNTPPSVMTGDFRIRIDDEIILVGGVAGSSLTGLTRGVEGTTATSHADNATVSHVLTAGGLIEALGASAGLDAHLSDTVDAHDASAISFTPAGTIAATTVQAAIEEVASEGGGGTDPDALTKFGGGVHQVHTVSASGATETLNPADGNIFDVTLTDNCTITLTSPASGIGCEILLIVRQGGTGGYDITWPGSVTWANGVPPVLATAVGDFNVIALLTVDGGTEWVQSNPNVGGGAADSGYIAALSADPDVVQYWPLNEAYGATSFNDVMGGTDLTVNVLTAVAGLEALNGDATGASYGMPSSVNHVLERSAITWPTSEWTYMGLFELLGTGGAQGILGQWNGAGSMIYTTGSQLHAFCGGGNIVWTPPSLGQMFGKHLIAVRHTGSHFQMVIDGVQRATGAVASYPLPGTNVGGDWNVGSYNNASQTAFAGRFSDIAIFDKAKTDAELLAYTALAGI